MSLKRFSTNAIVLAVLTVLVSACETVEGAGRDLQTAGATVSQEARQAQY